MIYSSYILPPGGHSLTFCSRPLLSVLSSPWSRPRNPAVRSPRLPKRPPERNRGSCDIKSSARGVCGGRWYNMTGHHTSDILASWFILALSSLHYCHTLLHFFPGRLPLPPACGNGLTNLGDDQTRSHFPMFDNKNDEMKGDFAPMACLLDRSLSARTIQAFRGNRLNLDYVVMYGWASAIPIVVFISLGLSLCLSLCLISNLYIIHIGMHVCRQTERWIHRNGKCPRCRQACQGQRLSQHSSRAMQC